MVLTHLTGIGYEGRSVAELITELKGAGVEVVVDIRLTPLSRKAGFSKLKLGAALESAGIRYIHDRRLGNPKENRAAYASASHPGGIAAREYFRSRLATGDGALAIREIAQLAGHYRVALLCFEADQDFCHREQVAGAVRDYVSGSGKSKRPTDEAIRSGG